MKASMPSRQRSTHWRILTGAVTVGVFAAAVKVGGAVKVAAMARFFGAGDDLDAFLIAFLIPAFFGDVIAGAYSPSLIPVLIRTRASQSEGAARRLVQNALAAILGALLICAILLAASANLLLPMLGSSFSVAKLRLAEKLFLALLVWLPISGCIAVWRAVLNAAEEFALVAAAPSGAPVLTIALLFLAGKWAGVYVLCYGTLLGVFLEAAILASAVRSRGFSILPAWNGFTPELGAVLTQYAPLALGALVASASIFVDQGVAGTMGSGAVSALTYGTKLTGVLLAIGGTALTTVVLPHFSRAAAAQDWKRLRGSFTIYSMVALMASIPLAILLIVFSEPLIRIFFQRGAFDTAAALTVAAIQKFSLLQVPFAALNALAIRLAAALGANDALFRAAMAAMGTNVVCDLLFVRWLGLPGIALAAAVVQITSLSVLLMQLIKTQRGLVR